MVTLIIWNEQKIKGFKAVLGNKSYWMGTMKIQSILFLALMPLLFFNSAYAMEDVGLSESDIGANKYGIRPNINALIEETIKEDAPQQNLGYIIEFKERPLVESKSMLCCV